MPPRARITKDMVVDAALEVVRKAGVESVNARTVARELNCSTQPVMYHFATMAELKRAMYDRADRLHTEYLLDPSPGEDPILGIGLNYIRFAVREPQLFRLLFQSGFAAERSLAEMIDSPALEPVLSAMGEGLEMSEEQRKNVFLTVALFTHGYASIIAGNALEFDETLVAAHLERVFRGAVMAVSEEERQ